MTLEGIVHSSADPDAATKEMEGASAANMQLHVVGQPDAKKLMKDDEVRFTGTLSAMTQSPFMLTWDNSKVNPDDLKDAAPDKPTPGAKRVSRQTGQPCTRPRRPRRLKNDLKNTERPWRIESPGPFCLSELDLVAKAAAAALRRAAAAGCPVYRSRSCG